MMRSKNEIRRWKSKVIVLAVSVVMILGQLPLGSFVSAYRSGAVQTQLSSSDTYTQKIGVKILDESITGVELQCDGKILETRQAAESLSFDVHRNGEYLIAGFSSDGVQQSEDTVKVDSFADLAVEENDQHEITILSRYEGTDRIEVSGADEKTVEMAVWQPDVYKAIYQAEKNGEYIFTAVDADGKELGRGSHQVRGIAVRTETGETVLSSEDDLKQIISNPTGSFVLGNDIEMTSDILRDITFTGTLDGRGYVLGGISDRLFGEMKNATIRNVIIRGRLAEKSVNSAVEDSGFYVEFSDEKKDAAVIIQSDMTVIRNSFAFMNAEGRHAAGFILEGTGEIESGYVSGYISGEKVYGFGRDVNVTDSYISATLKGEDRTLLSEGKRTDCFYDGQINDLSDEEAEPYHTEEMISGKLKRSGFRETEGSYPEIRNIETFSESGQKLSRLSVLSVRTESNLSALEKIVTVDNEREWNTENVSLIGGHAALRGTEGELSASSGNAVNRFGLMKAEKAASASAGKATTSKTTQITYPVTINMYYRVVKSGEGNPTLPASHKEAVENGWKVMYWSGNSTQTGLEWNTKYTVYSTDLSRVNTDSTLQTVMGKNGGKLKLTGDYDVGNTMTVTLSGANTLKGTLYWERADRTDGTWTEIRQTPFDGSRDSATYAVQDTEKAKYLRARFETDTATGYEGTLTAATDHAIRQAIAKVSVTNKTKSDGTYTLQDQLVAEIEPAGKENEAVFTWYREGDSEAIATGRNYTLKAEDIGKKIYVKAAARSDGELKGEKMSISTSEVQTIQCQQPNISILEMKGKDDITVTLSANAESGLYQFGYASSQGGEITPYPTLARAKTDMTVTGLKAGTDYFIYVRQVGENGYANSKWSSSAYTFRTDAEHVRGDVTITGNAVYSQQLTAAVSNKPSEHTGEFEWYRLDSSGERIADTKKPGDTYSLGQDDIGHKIEAVYKGTGDYAGEVTNISETVSKEEKAAPTANLSIRTSSTDTDTTIEITMPKNSDGEKYILGLSRTQNGIPIEHQENGTVKEFVSGEEYRITGLERDTDYYLFIRYASNATHEKSDWIDSSAAAHQKTTKKAFAGDIEFRYETADNTLVKGQTVTAELKPADKDFNYKGTWTWTRKVNGAASPVNNFTLSSDRHSTSYTVPSDETAGAVYTVKFEANVGYQGETSADTAAVKEPVKGKYAAPKASDIVMEKADDSSIRVMMSDGEGNYQFWYKKKDTNVAASVGGFFTELFTGDDGYTKVEKTVGSSVDLVIDGLERNTEYVVKVQRTEDDNGEASDFAYSSDANKSTTTMKTDIAGHVTLKGDENYGKTLNAVYHQASYASSGSGSDDSGTWQWYRGNAEITDATSSSYTLRAEDIGKVIRAEYAIPDGENFQGSTSAETKVIEKALCINPKVTNIKTEDRNGTLTMVVTGEKGADDEIYYRLQKAGDTAPVYPSTADQLKGWNAVLAETISIIRDANNIDLAANENYTIYYIKRESATQKGSEVISKTYRMGTKSQKGTMKFSGSIVSGKSVTAELTGSNNTSGTWHWYMSTKRYGYDSLSAMPSETDASAWKEITEGFSPVLNTEKSTLAVTEDMFARYIRVEFVANEEQGYSGTVKAGDNTTYVKKVYDETVTVTSSTKDGNGNPKAYSGTVITGTVNNYAESGTLDRATIQFMIKDKTGSSVAVSGSNLTVQDNTFTYAMPNNQSYDGDEITAEISKPKYSVLFVNEDLTPITAETLSSKTSTNTSLTYSYGIPISTADDLENFMLAKTPYNDRSSNSKYVVTSNINMSTKNVIQYSETPFQGTLDGDFHTIVGVKNPLFAYVYGISSKYANIEKFIFLNANVDTLNLGVEVGSGSSVIARQVNYVNFNQIMLVDSKMNGKIDAGFLTALILSSNGQDYSTDANINECFSAGGNVATQKGSMGSLVGHFRRGTLQNSCSVNTPLGNADVYKGGLVGSAYRTATIKNSYTASAIPDGNKSGGLSASQQPATGQPLYATVQNGFYDRIVSGIANPISNTGTPKNTNEMIGTGLQSAFGSDGTWTYADGYYPRLTWIAEHPIAKLYTATRGAFTSVDGRTSSDDMFNGNISGVIQIPAELLTKDYSIHILNASGAADQSVLKIGDNGTIIPVGSASQKATVKITYTEPDASIGGTASNTYEFTVKETVRAMNPVSIVDGKTNAALNANPEMNQTLKANAVQGASYQWYRRRSGSTDSEIIAGATSQTYTVKAADIGYEFAVLAKANGYADTYSSYTNAAVAIKPGAPAVSNITDSSVMLSPVNGEDGLTYEFGYMRADENAAITVADTACDRNGKITIDNLVRNKQYRFYVRVAAKEGSYEAGDWSSPASGKLLQTAVDGSVILGTEVNNGRKLTMQIEAVNGQTGTWKLERLAAASDTVLATISSNYSAENACEYTLTTADVGNRIRATYTGSGDYKGTRSAATEIIKKSMPSSAPKAPVKVSETDGTLTVKADADGSYDIGYAASSSDAVIISKQNIAGKTDCTIGGLKRNTSYYIYARSTETGGSEASQWSSAAVYTTAKSSVSGELSVQGDLMTDSILTVSAPSMDDLSGTWKVERISGKAVTTIAPKDYTAAGNKISYKLKPKDALSAVRVTFTGTGDYTGSVTRTSNTVQNGKQDNTSDMPGDIEVTDIQDHTVKVTAKDGRSTYQFGYAQKGTASITWTDATAEAGKAIRLTGLKRNSEYDIHVRKAAKTGYNWSDPVKMNTGVKTGKTVLNGSVDYEMTGGTYRAGEAEIGRTYKAVYTSGKYEQTGDDTGGSWQWYADDRPISGATLQAYTVGAMEGSPEITVRYTARENSGFTSFIRTGIGTLTKPAYSALSKLPAVTAEPEDGSIGSRLKITADERDNVYYYVQKADNTKVPSVQPSSEVIKNTAGLDRWFQASAENTVDAAADTDYVVYAARLEDGEHQSSGVVSQRAVRTVKEELDRLTSVSISETDSTKWKVLQEKELRISAGGKAVDGIWQYYVSSDSRNPALWQNITSEVKGRVSEGKSDSYTYTEVNMPVKYNGYFVRAVFTGRGSYQGHKIYDSAEKLTGTQIRGSVSITSGDASEVFMPIEAKYVFAKNESGAQIEDERNGIWTWYRETAKDSGKYEKIERSGVHVGVNDTYVPSAEDVDRKIYAEYTGAREGIYSGSAASDKLKNVSRVAQNRPETPQEKQVSGTAVQISLPSNYKTEGKSIPELIVEYRVKGSSEKWTVNDAGSAWIGRGADRLKAHTDYEVRVKFAGTGEYLPSGYSELLYIKTGNQSFDEDSLTLSVEAQPKGLSARASETMEVGAKVTAKYSGAGYDEGEFVIARSNGEVVASSVSGTVAGNETSAEYTVTSDDIGSNLIFTYQAKASASTYGGAVEKSTSEVLKPQKAAVPGTPQLETVTYDETVLKIHADSSCEYVLNTADTAVSENLGDWQKLTSDSQGYHTFTGLDKSKKYYLHVRYAETQTERCSAENVSAATGPWASSTYTITYQGIEGATNGTPANPTEFTELSSEITLRDASKNGYTFTGWTSPTVKTPAKGLTIPTHTSGNQTFTANWELNTYTIAYELDGGSLKSGDSNPADYTVETADFALKNPEKKGYTFQGWTWNGQTAPQKAVTIQKGTYGEKTYTANWSVNQYTASFDGNGGSDGTEISRDYNMALGTLPEPSREGYTFAGWFTEKNGGTQIAADTKMPSENVTYYAHWTINQYTATFDGNGGSNETAIQKNYEEELGTLPTSSRAGYTFAGWFTEATEGTQITEKTKMPSKNVTYYAHWRINQYTVTFNGNGGSDGTAIQKNYEEELGALPTSSRAGYTFDGWFTEKTGGNEITEKTKMPLNGAEYYAHWIINEYQISYDMNDESSGEAVNDASNPSVYTIESEDISLHAPTWTGHTFVGWTWDGQSTAVLNPVIPKGSTGNRAYTASWQLSKYTVHFDSHGGSTVKDRGATHGLPVSRPADPTKEGYTFRGWFTSEQYASEWNFSSPVSGEMTLHAKWEINHYDILFDTDGGTAVDKQTVDHGELIQEPANPSRDYYEFAGWYSDRQTSSAYDFNVPVEAAMTLYAKWIPIQYDIIYDLDGGISIGNPDSYTVEDEIVLKEPEKENFTFVGWTYEGMSIPQRNLTIIRGTHGALNLKANWKLNEYTVHFSSEGGSETASQTVRHGELLNVPTDPVREGYVFDGWYTDRMHTSKWNFMTETVKSEMTLYAGYREILKSVKAEPGNGSHLNKGTEVVLSAEHEADIYYTTDGSEPTRESQKYDQAIAIENAVTIRAFACAEGYADSPEASFSYTVKGNSEVSIAEDSPVRLGNTHDEIIRAVVNEQEYQNYLNGTDVRVRIECQEISEGHDSRGILEGMKAARFYDIVIYRTVGEGEEERITQLYAPLRLIFDIPEELYQENEERIFGIVHQHERRTEYLEDQDDERATVTVESESFSTYILCYRDQTKQTAAETAVVKKPESETKSVKRPESSIVNKGTEETPEKESQKDTEKRAEGEVSVERQNYLWLILTGLSAGVGIIFVIIKRKKKDQK